MKTLIHTLFNWIVSRLRERWYLSLEYLALQHQLEVLRRSAKRPQFSSADRGLWLILSRVWSQWPHAVEIMQADTVKRWRRQGLRHHFRWRRGRKRPGRPPIASETRELMHEMSRDNRLWGAPRIQGELAKLGIKVSRTTVAKYMDRRPGPPSPSWRTFWRLHAPDLLVREVYAELSGRLRAGDNRVIVVLRHALWRRVSGWLRRMLCHHVVPLTQAADPNFEPVSRSIDAVEMVRAFGRSPPLGWSSIDPTFPLNPPIKMGKAKVRLDTSRRHGCDTPPKTACISQDDNTVQRSDASEQNAA